MTRLAAKHMTYPTSPFKVSRYSGKEPGMPGEKYPLAVESVGGDTYIVMSRGHRDLREFMAEVIKDYGDWNLGGAQHVWIKTTPAKGGWNYNIVDQKTRGAWPATYRWEYGEGFEEWRLVKPCA